MASDAVHMGKVPSNEILTGPLDEPGSWLLSPLSSPLPPSSGDA